MNVGVGAYVGGIDADAALVKFHPLHLDTREIGINTATIALGAPDSQIADRRRQAIVAVIRYTSATVCIDLESKKDMRFFARAGRSTCQDGSTDPFTA